MVQKDIDKWFQGRWKEEQQKGRRNKQMKEKYKEWKTIKDEINKMILNE